MPNPLRIRYSGSAFQDLIEMTNAELLANFGYLMAKEFATTNAYGTLAVQAGSAPAGTSIGSWTDTWRTEPVNSPNNANATGATSSQTYFMTQNTTDPGSSWNPKHLTPVGSHIEECQVNGGGFWDIGVGNAVAIAIMNETLPGKYRLQVATPSGGTWTSRGTVVDTTDSAGGGTTTTYTLWQKTEVASPPSAANRPLKWDSSNSSIKEMTDTEQRASVTPLRKHMLTQGFGRYRFQTSVPGLSGTWTQCGDTVNDTIQQYTQVGAYFNVTATIVSGSGGSIALWGQTNI